MKCLWVGILATACFGQHLEFGVKGGFPLSPALETSSGPVFRDQTEAATSDTRAYIVGPMVGLRLPHGFGLEVEALYSRLGFDDLLTSFLFQGPPIIVQTRTVAGSWEFPILGKFRLKRFPATSPYIDGGASFRYLTGVSTTGAQTIFTPAPGLSLFHNSNFGIDRSNRGGVVGVGLEFRAAVLRISPELRYTRWGADRTGNFFAVHSNQNEVSFLVGIAF